MSGDPRLPGDVNHLNRLLTRWAAGEGDSPPAMPGRLRRLVGVVVIAAALDGLRDADGVERIGFKGGSALELRFGTRARASKDLDAAFRGMVAEALVLAGDALSAGWNGFTAVLGPRQEIIRAGVTPPPVRVDVKVRYRGRPFVTIPLEVSAAEGRSMQVPEVLPPAMAMAPVQIPDVEAVSFLPIRYQVAQKLHACTEECDPPNQRVRDLADLLLIEELALAADDLPAVREACLETFELRAKHPWPPTITLWPDWPLMWERLAVEERLDRTLESAASAVTALIEAIDAAG